MKLIGFLGKGKDSAEPVLEYHPPYDEEEQEEEEFVNEDSQTSWEDSEETSQEQNAGFDGQYLGSRTGEKKKGRRRMVTAALVMALGAAVYLNWQFSGNQELLASDTLSSEREMGTAQLVNGDAEETDASAAEEQESVFTQAKLSRQKARDEAVEMLEEVLKDSESSEEAKKEAVAQSAVIAQNVLKENNIENLVKAKGYADCVAVIQDIVVGQTDFAPEKIKIIEAK